MDWLSWLRDDFRAHKYSYLISLFVTLLGGSLYTYTYLAEAQTWLALLTDSFELKTYDTRFRIRGHAEPSSDILIVAIDEKTFDEFGWPFSRVHYTRMLENLRADGAAVIGFDITFPKPDEKSGLEAVRGARQAYLQRTVPRQRDPDYLRRLEEMERQADTDAQFAAALFETPNVVLGQFFYRDPSKVEHIDPEQQEEYEMVLAFGAYPQVRPLPRVEEPQITVTTVWPGARPQEIEREIVDEQEEQLKALEGLIKMESSSSDSVGNITLTFQMGTDLDTALLKVSNRLEQVPSYPGDAEKPVIRSADPLMPPPLAETYTGLDAYMPRPNLMAFAEAVNFNFGYFNFEPDADAIARRTSLVIKYDQDFYPSLDVQVLRRYLGVPDQEFGLFYNEAGVEYIQFGDLKVRTDPVGRILINFQGPAETYSHVSLSDVAAGNFEPGTFTGKMVLVGPTATAIGDMHAVPLQATDYPGVEVHANVLDTMLNQRFIRRGLTEELFDLGFILLFGLGVGFVLARVPPSWTTPLTVSVLGVFLVVTYLVFVRFQAWWNIVVPAMVLVNNFAAVTAYRVLVEEREKRKVRGAFSQYVPPGVIRELMKDPDRLKLGGEERQLTIMFTDIRGFTALSEKLSALELTHFLNAYTDEMTDIIFRHWGTLDKFEGDAIMAFWGAPYEQEDHTLRACAAALDMQRRVDELRQQWRAEGKPDINIGVGLNSGQVVVGNMGSRKRFNYTVLGDPVNLASRLEGVNKEYSTRIIVSEFTHQQASDAIGVLERRIGRQFGVSPAELVSRDGSPAAQRARQVALYLCSTKRLAAPKVLAQRFGGGEESSVAQAVDRVEQWEMRDKKLARFLSEVRRSFHSFIFRQLDWIRVKGKREPVAIYELLDYGGDDARYADLLAMFEGGLQAYRAQHWNFAIDLFEAILQVYPDDKPSRLFIERCRQYQAQPPSSTWDGVWVMKTK